MICMTTTGRLLAATLDQPLDRPLLAIGACNAVTASIAARAGFDALWISGLEVSAACGLPDSNALTVTELSAAVLAVSRVASLPIIVDIDNAGGTTVGATRCSSDLGRLGVAAVCLEDSKYPKANSFRTDASHELAEAQLVLDQISAIREACADLFIIARTQALVGGGSPEAAVNRATRYAAAGADAILIHSRDATGSEALSVAAKWPLDTPLVTVPTAFEHLSWEVLGAAGFRLCIYANQLTRSAMQGMQLALSEFSQQKAFNDNGNIATIEALLGIADPNASIDRDCWAGGG
jgi:phosphoenolpyruvate phosphomutase